MIAQSVQFSKTAKKLNIDLCQSFSHRKEGLSLLKSWNKKGGHRTRFYGRAEKVRTKCIFLDFWERTGASFKIECMWKGEESIKKSAFTEYTKKDLVACAVVVQAPSVGGCSVVDVKLKVQSLLVQWVRRFVMAQSSWSGFMGFWFHSVFNSSPTAVFSRPFAFSPRALPPFYQSLLLAWWR